MCAAPLPPGVSCNCGFQKGYELWLAELLQLKGTIRKFRSEPSTTVFTGTA